jgi:hypothetical protein
MPSNEELLLALEAISAAERRFSDQETEDAAESLLDFFAARQATIEKADGLSDRLKEIRDRLLQDGESIRVAVAAARGVVNNGDTHWRHRRDYGHRLGAVARDLYALVEAGGIA